MEPVQSVQKNQKADPSTSVVSLSKGAVSEGGLHRSTEEDEINLVDLFIVLLKRRRIVLGLPLLTALAAGIILFVLPAFGILSFQTYTLQAAMTSVQLPPALREQVGLDLVGLTEAYGQEFHLVLDAIIDSNLRIDGMIEDPEDLRFRTFIQKSFIGGPYKVTSAEEGVRFQVQVRDSEAGKRFLRDIINRIDSRLRTQVANRARVIHQSMEHLYREAGPATVLSDTVRQLITSSFTYSQGDIPILIPISEPEVFLEPQRRSVTFVVSVVSAFFIAVFLAFAVEYIHNLKQDPQTMAKIRSALGKG